MSKGNMKEGKETERREVEETRREIEKGKGR